jgi:hypothetical protein
LNSLDVGDGFAEVCLSDLMLFAGIWRADRSGFVGAL